MPLQLACAVRTSTSFASWRACRLDIFSPFRVQKYGETLRGGSPTWQRCRRHTNAGASLTSTSQWPIPGKPAVCAHARALRVLRACVR